MSLDPAELARLAAAATPGPWTWQAYETGVYGEYSKQSVYLRAPSVRIESYEQRYGRLVLCYEKVFAANDRGALVRPADAAYIAAASPGVVLALLARLALLRDLIEDAQWYQPYSNSSPSCPWCINFQYEGHTVDCPALRALDAGETT